MPSEYSQVSIELDLVLCLDNFNLICCWEREWDTEHDQFQYCVQTKFNKHDLHACQTAKLHLMKKESNAKTNEDVINKMSL